MSDKKRMIKAIITGVICALLVNIILMCIFAVVMLTGGLLNADVIRYAMVGIIAAGAFAGGFIATKINKGAGLPVGVITGISTLVMIALVSIIKGSYPITSLIVIKLIACVIAGAIGGVVGLKERKDFRI